MTDLTPFPPHPIEITLLIASHLDFDSLRLFASTSRSTRKVLKPLLLTTWRRAYSSLYSTGFRGRIVTYSIENRDRPWDDDPIPKKSSKLVAWLLWFLVVSDYDDDAGINRSIDCVFEVGKGVPGLYGVQCLCDVMELRRPKSIEGGALARRYNALLAPRKGVWRGREAVVLKALVGAPSEGEDWRCYYYNVVETLEEEGLTNPEAVNVEILKILLGLRDVDQVDEAYILSYFLEHVCQTVMDRRDQDDHVVEDEAKYEEILELVVEKMPGCIVRVRDHVTLAVADGEGGTTFKNGPASLKEMGNPAAWMFATAYSSYAWELGEEEEGSDMLRVWFEKFRNSRGLAGCFDLALAQCFTDVYTFEWKELWIPVLLDLGANPNAVLKPPVRVGDPDVTWTPLHPVMEERGSITMFRLFLEKGYTGIDIAIRSDGQEPQVPMVYLAHQYRDIRERRRTSEDGKQISEEEVLQMLKDLLQSRPGCVDLPQWSEVLEIAEDVKAKGDDALWEAVRNFIK